MVEIALEVEEIVEDTVGVVSRTTTQDVDDAESGKAEIKVSGSSPPKKSKKTWIKRKKEPVLQSEDDVLPEVEKKRIALLNRPEMPAACTVILGSIGMGMVMPSFSIVFSSMIGVFYEFYLNSSELVNQAQKWSLVFVAIGFGALLSAIIQNYSFNYMGQRLGRRIRVLTMEALLRQEIGWFDDEKNASGILSTKLNTDAMAVKGQFGDSMGLITQNAVTLVA